MTTDLPHSKLVETALSQYPIKVRCVDFIRHSGALVHRVEDERGNEYALRLHQHISDFLSGSWQTPKVINSEMVWLSHLHDETDIVVQEPIKTTESNWLALVDLPTGETSACTLHRWLNGSCPAPPFTAEDAQVIAFLLADLHIVAEHWSAPDGFARPTRDSDHLLRALSHIERLVSLGVIVQSDFDCIRMAADQILPTMAQLGTGPESWGLIHGDLIPSNIVFYQGVASPIDFSESSFGFYLYDIAVCMLRLGPHRRTFLDTYSERRTLPENARLLVETFLVAQFVEWLAFLSYLPERYDRAARGVPQIAAEVCTPFLNSIPFLFEPETYNMRASNKEIQATN